MKKLLLLLPLLLSVCLVFGLVNEYSFVQSSETYTPITGGTVVNTGTTDDTQFAVTLPFPFTYNEVAVTTGAMSSNGYLSFGAGTSSFSYAAISSGAVGTGVIAPLSLDLQGGTLGEMRWESFGTAPNRYVIYQWKNYRAYGSANLNDNWNFQVILYETSNQIAIRYGTFTWAGTFSGTAQVGMRGATNADYVARTSTTSWAATTAAGTNTATITLNSTIFPSSGLQFKWTPPVASLPPNPANIVSPANGATGVSKFASLNWTSGGGLPTGYKVYFGTTIPATPNATITGNTWSPTGMQYNTAYQWKIVPFNDNGDAVDCPVWSFTTMNDPTITNFPYLTDFETWPPVNWSLTGGTFSFTQFLSGTNNWARANYWGQQAGNTDIMTTPPLNPTQPSRLVFTWSHLYSSTYPTDALTVRVSSDLTNWTDIWTRAGEAFNSNDGAGTTTPGTGVQATVAIPPAFIGNPFFVQFYGYSGYGPDLFIDNVIIEAVPEAPIFAVAPTSWDFGNVTINTVATKVFTVTNNGGGLLSFVPTVNGTHFTLSAFDPSTLPLGPGQSTTFTVAFQPASVNSYISSVTVTDPVTSAVYAEIPLTGSCLAPNPVATMIPANLATGVAINPIFSWTAGAAPAPTGYKLYLGTNNPPTNLVNGTDLGLVTTYTHTGFLAANTMHYWTVVPYNLNGDAAGNVTQSFTTGTLPSYPTSGATSAADTDIGQVIIGTFANPTTAPTTILNNPDATGMYSDFTHLGPIQVQIGASVPVSITQITSGGTFYASYVKVFIDYNQNGAFDLPGEVAFEGPITQTANPLVGSFVVPAGTLLGNTRLRIVQRESGSTTTTLPTGTYSWGETEDYTVQILAGAGGLPNNATLLSPANNVINLPLTGPTLTWSPSSTGGVPTGYTVFVSNDVDDIFGQLSWETTNTSFNLATAVGFTPAYSDRWFWAVVPFNGDGEADVDDPAFMIWNFEYRAAPIAISTFPHNENFDALTIPNMPTDWTIIGSQAGADNRQWRTGTGQANSAPNAAMVYYHGSFPKNEWMITPALALVGGNTYGVRFQVKAPGWAGTPERLALYAGTEPTSANLLANAPIWNNPNMLYPNYVEVIAAFTPVSTGHYYLGWHAYSIADVDFIAVDDISIYQVQLNDVGVANFVGMNEVMNAVPFAPQATIQNFGSNAVTFDVVLTDGNGYSSSQTVTNLAANTTQVVSFATYTPALNSVANFNATTMLAGDTNTANDTQMEQVIFLDLNLVGYADVAYNPGGLLGPAWFNLHTPGVINDLPAAVDPARTSFMPGADWSGANWIGTNYDAVPSNILWNIATTDGAMTQIGNSGVAANVNGFAYDAVAGVWYGTTYDGANSLLYTIDPSGVATLVGTITNGGLIIGLAHDNFLGVLYGVDLLGDILVTINKTSAVATPVGTGLGYNLNYAQDLSIDQNTGLLYMAGYTTSGYLMMILPSNGAAYIVGGFQNGAELTGFAIPWYAGGLEAPEVQIVDGTLTWNAVPGASSYKIYSAENPSGPFSLVTTTALTSYAMNMTQSKLFYHVIAQDVVRAGTRVNIDLPSKVSPNGGRSTNTAERIKR